MRAAAERRPGRARAGEGGRALAGAQAKRSQRPQRRGFQAPKHPNARAPGHGPRARRVQADGRLTNARPSAIYKVTPPAAQAQGPAQVGIEIAPLPAVEALAAQRAASREKGAEIAAKVDVGKVAEKVVKNVSCALRPHALLTHSSGTTSTRSATRSSRRRRLSRCPSSRSGTTTSRASSATTAARRSWTARTRFAVRGRRSCGLVVRAPAALDNII